jgi:hypothetical protein
LYSIPVIQKAPRNKLESKDILLFSIKYDKEIFISILGFALQYKLRIHLRIVLFWFQKFSACSIILFLPQKAIIQRKNNVIEIKLKFA